MTPETALRAPVDGGRARRSGARHDAAHHPSTTRGGEHAAAHSDERSLDGRGRLAEREQELQALERRQPLRRRLLEALSEAPGTPTELAQRVGSRRESVSRRLTELQREGLVTRTRHPDDRRQIVCALTREGIAQLSLHRAFGVRAAPPEAPTARETHAFLRSAVRNAEQMRRRTNLLGEAYDRLELVLEQARGLDDPELRIEATHQLITTARQARRIDEVYALLGELEELERSAFAGEAHDVSLLTMQALAHREYALGRLGQDDGAKRPRTRARHLYTAQTLYGELASRVAADQAGVWHEREAWCIVSAADVLRERSRFEDAIARAADAMELFSKLEDPYGRSRCLFMLGFCLRLMGDFERAWGYLDAAHGLASAHAFERFQADSLMQLGDVRRCQGDAARAGELLGEAVERSEHMGLLVTQGFAQSALGAVAYERDDLDAAVKALDAAHELFVRSDHREGLALNARRHATVARRMAHARRRSQLRAVRERVLDAFARYRELSSPAGMAACEVEVARVQLIGERSPKQAIEQLLRRLGNTPERELLEQDPWVPGLLAGFAADASEADLREQALVDDLREQSQRLVEGADRWRASLSEDEAPSARPVRRARRASAETLRRLEMGGEPRRQFPPLPRRALPQVA